MISRNRAITKWLAAVLFLTGSAGLRADIIDFETGFADFQSVGSILTATNVVDITVGNGYHGALEGCSLAAPCDAFIAAVGGLQTAFTADDLPEAGASPGSFFLTDEPLDNVPMNRSFDFFFDFLHPVWDFSLDLYDYRADGFRGNLDDSATLSAFADAARTVLLDIDTWNVREHLPLPDGNLSQLSITVGVIPIAALTLSYPYDPGTGIDNISFTTTPLRVPSPGTFAITVLGLLLLATRAGRQQVSTHG